MMDITKNDGKTTTNHVQCLLEEATHFRFCEAIYPLHEIVDRTTAPTHEHRRYLGSHGCEYAIKACAPLKAVKVVAEESYDIKLSKGEAQVLAEVLRMTRVGGSPHKDVEAVCATLWGQLPTGAISIQGGPIHVSKPA